MEWNIFNTKNKIWMATFVSLYLWSSDPEDDYSTVRIQKGRGLKAIHCLYQLMHK